MENKAVIYSRVSLQDLRNRERQDYSRQTNELEEYANYKKMNVLKVFEEKVTGTSKVNTRTEYNNMIQFIEENQVKNVLLWELSRLGRNMANVVEAVNYFTEQGINLYIHKESLNTLNPDGTKNPLVNVIIGVLSGFSEIEVETTRQRIKSGLRHSKKNGGANQAIQPYGYKSVNKKLVIDEQESKIIKLIFKLYLQGLGIHQIAGHLNNENIPTRYKLKYKEQELLTRSGKKKQGNNYYWVGGTVYHILGNDLYTGYRKYKDEKFYIKELAIIKKKDFKQVQKTLKEKSNVKNRKTLKFENNFKGLIWCNECGQSYYMHKRSSGKDQAYKCLSKRLRHYKKDFAGCNNPSIGIDKLNMAVYGLFEFTGMSDELNNELYNKEKIKELNKEIELNNIELNSYNKELTNYNNQLKNLLDLQLTGKIKTEIYTSKYDELNNLIEGTQRKIETTEKQLQEQKNILKKIKVKKNLKLTDENLGIIIKQLIQKITIHSVNEPEFLNKYTNKQDYVVRVVIDYYNGFSSELLMSQRSKNIYKIITTNYINSGKKEYDFINLSVEANEYKKTP